MEPIIIPPMRTCLEDIESVKSAGRADNPPRTEKSWYFYWQRNGEKLASLVTSGTHANRPDVGAMPDGALYTETDRGYVLYQNVGGVWQYVAGTMWGTLSPDQRPTDLGTNDAGFEFRSVDPDQYLNGRDFLWSQSEWIEITPVRYGTHAQRLALAAASLWSGMLFVETDRGGVTYQNQNGTWHYLSGTMWGTLSPDQRPTDLGVNDAGFDFRTTDTTPGREFLWSQTAWVEITGLVDPTTAKGDLIVRGSAAPPTRLPAGADGQVLTANSTQPLGVAWAAAAGAFRNTAVVTGSRAIGSVYQNTHPGTMFVTVITTLTSSGSLGAANFNAFSDNTSNPATNLDSVYFNNSNAANIGLNCSVKFMVMPNNYYKVTANGNSGLIWVEYW
jgi:hypothetical protein